MKSGIMNYLLLLAVLTAALSGCGETFRGAGKDVSRIGYGVKTIFVSQQ